METQSPLLPGSPLVDIEDLSLFLPGDARQKMILHHIDWHLCRGEHHLLLGHNGAGKTTLMRLMHGLLWPAKGRIVWHTSEGEETSPIAGRAVSALVSPDQQENYQRQRWYITGRELLLTAFEDTPLLYTNTSEQRHAQVEDMARRLRALDLLDRMVPEVSQGQLRLLLLGRALVRQPDLLLLDEPTNHLDTSARERFYDFIRRTSATALIISHDRTLLNLLPAICELSRNKLTYYGGSYDFYKEQKKIHQNALLQQLEEKEKAFRLARKTAREVEERKAKQNVRGEKAALKKGIPRIMMGNLKNHAENSTGKLNNIHIQKSEKIRQEVMDIRNSLSQTDKLKTDFNASALHTGKILVTAQNINFHYPDSNTNLWTVPLSFQLRSGNRFCIKGDNGSGKTTLLRLITGELTPTGGTIERADFTYVYLDQEYSLIQNEYTVSEQAEAFNLRHLPEHEIKTVLNRYLFPQDVWNKPCGKLSGGEKMRLAFCCLMIADNTPDLFILDEPTNNLDIESIEIITATIRNYQGTVLAVSHDRDFLKETGIEQEISFFL